MKSNLIGSKIKPGRNCDLTLQGLRLNLAGIEIEVRCILAEFDIEVGG